MHFATLLVGHIEVVVIYNLQQSTYYVFRGILLSRLLCVDLRLRQRNNGRATETSTVQLEGRAQATSPQLKRE